MIEIVFDIVEAELLKTAMNRSYKNASENIICLNGKFDVGMINNTEDSDVRRQVFYDMKSLNANDEEVECEWQFYLENWNRLKVFANKGETFRIWYANAPYSICGFYYVCYLLKDKHCQINAIKLPDSIIKEGGYLQTFSDMRELSPDMLNQFFVYEHKLEQIEVMHYAICWQELIEHSLMLRVNVNGRVLNVDDDFYDFLIEQKLTKQEVSMMKIVGLILSNYEIGIRDVWLIKRILLMIDCGKIKIVKQMERDMIIQRI